ncbi:hypothetical protein K504DRAFT_529080 [Pleomassaria siparia CBS 279.74]|uniref:CENP-V/GFA domain-containing protein n=1 Tax=Pleomassaria siparia CBS 279.74 TaxID=1314801 RepID=A0A6G1KPJ1_9PLEO|nr:hypothetical protein K504DRAFT_529080 [Pleomassaria siparia CBS 279.74]
MPSHQVPSGLISASIITFSILALSRKTFTPLKGHCTCKTITYEVVAPFLVTNCCHCTWCQRETGTVFVLNAIIETSNFRITSETKPVFVYIPSASGDGQMIARCPTCYVALYGDYVGDGAWTTFVKAGTLDDDGKKRVKPDVHIFTSTKMDWVDLTSERERGVPILEKGYKREDVWSREANERFAALKLKMDAAKKVEEMADQGKAYIEV